MNNLNRGQGDGLVLRYEKLVNPSYSCYLVVRRVHHIITRRSFSSISSYLTPLFITGFTVASQRRVHL